MKGRVLIIAGSDSSGGAGVQADIKTASAFGAYAATAITAITVQNTRGITAVHAVPSQIVADQIAAVLDDIGADVVKTGMLGSVQTVEAVAAALAPVRERIPLVIDPVMVAQTGARLLDEDAIGVLKADVIRYAHILTPNISEAEVLAGGAINSVGDMIDAAERLLSLGPKAVLLTGGHMDSDSVDDVFMTLDGQEVFSGPRIDTRHTHGSGCTLASAIAACLSQGRPMRDAVLEARNFVFEAIRTAPGLGHGEGPLNHLVHAQN